MPHFCLNCKKDKKCLSCSKKSVGDHHGDGHNHDSHGHYNPKDGPIVTNFKYITNIDHKKNQIPGSEPFPNRSTVPTVEEIYHDFLLSSHTHKDKLFKTQMKRHYYDPFIMQHPSFKSTNFDTKYFIESLDWHKETFDHHNYDGYHYKIKDKRPCPKACMFKTKYFCPHHRPRCTPECEFLTYDYCPHHSIGCPRICGNYHKECCPKHRPHCPVNCNYVTKLYCPAHRPGCTKGCLHYHARFCPTHRPGCPRGCKFYNHLYCHTHRPRCPKTCYHFKDKVCPYHGYFNPYKPPQSINVSLWHDMLFYYGYHYDIKHSYQHLAKFSNKINIFPSIKISNGQNNDIKQCLTCPKNAYTRDKDGKLVSIQDSINKQGFGKSTSGNCNCPSGPVYNGLLNVKKARMSSSLNLDHKKNTQLFNDELENFNCQKEDMCKNPNSRHGGVGGPGKLDDSQPRFRTGIARGYKARLLTPLNRGVDKKHGSYDRYLMKKKALYQQKELCHRCK